MPVPTPVPGGTIGLLLENRSTSFWSRFGRPYEESRGVSRRDRRASREMAFNTDQPILP